MRLWHVDLLPLLPRQQILGQHSECTGMRGKGWGKKHATVNYVFTHSYACLFRYHCVVMDEMTRRGFNVAPEWRERGYRGKAVGYDNTDFTWSGGQGYRYPEHNAAYLAECIANLAGKNVVISAITA